MLSLWGISTGSLKNLFEASYLQKTVVRNVNFYLGGKSENYFDTKLCGKKAKYIAQNLESKRIMIGHLKGKK